jgi:hypothetical protein
MKRLLATCAAAVLLTGCTSAASTGTSGSGTSASGQPSAAASTDSSGQHQVQFKLTTPLKLSISYGLTSNMKTATSNGNWSETLSSSGNDVADLSFAPVDYSAAASADNVTCEILVDGTSKAKESVSAIGGKCFYQIP